ncbi:hypothetical protein sS8_4799 [Methylocaldum marinum]|uniref:Uncharacterized protein n=1 Tax=Methylocaldum marinum TaxID=1432792 RepID=A0A250KYQ5_9GAMM|nr:hypothetical protein sS8_4799 [Methylocaldum marinum]
MMVNNWSIRAFGGLLAIWAFSAPAVAQKFSPLPDDEEIEEASSGAEGDADLEFSEDERVTLNELRAWLRQRSFERAQAAAFGPDRADGAGSDAVYREVRPPQLLHDARNWQGRPKPRLHIGRMPEDRVRNSYATRDPKSIGSPRKQLILDSSAGHSGGTATPVETKTKSRVRLVWSADPARQKSNSRPSASERH